MCDCGRTRRRKASNARYGGYGWRNVLVSIHKLTATSLSRIATLNMYRRWTVLLLEKTPGSAERMFLLCCFLHSNIHRIQIPYRDGTPFAQPCSRSCKSLPDFYNISCFRLVAPRSWRFLDSSNKNRATFWRPGFCYPKVTHGTIGRMWKKLLRRTKKRLVKKSP